MLYSTHLTYVELCLSRRFPLTAAMPVEQPAMLHWLSNYRCLCVTVLETRQYMS